METPPENQQTAPPDGAQTEPAESHPRRRRWPILLGLLVGVVSVAVVWLIIGAGSEGRQVSTDEARDRLDPSSTLPQESGVLRPPQGVYLYRGSGTEVLNTPPREQAEGPDMPATVTHGEAGCWSFRIDYHSHHWQQWNYCPREDGLVEVGGESYVRWDFDIYVSETTSTFVCDEGVTVDPAARPDDEWTQECTSQESSEDAVVVTAGPYRFVGVEELDIGGETVEAYHYDRRRTMTGAQQGTEHTQAWFSTDTGLPLRNERELEVRVDSIIGQTVYTENGDFELVSLTPG